MMLSAQDQQAIEGEFRKLRGPVRVTVFASELGGETNQHAVALAKEVAGLSDQLSVQVLNPFIDREQALAYGLDSAAPAIVVEGARDYGLRFFGAPLGYEFSNFIDAILVASTGEPELATETKAALAALTDPVTIKVFTTPT
jgi:alkyl hydroperoxide reductase subunit AhpF